MQKGELTVAALGFVQNVVMVFKAFFYTPSSGDNFIYDGSSAEGLADVSGSSSLTGDYTTGTLTGDNETYLAVITSASDYYPFGAQMPTRNINPRDYRFGFNGMERDNEVKGAGNSYDFGARIYDPRTGRWLSLDPSQVNYPAVNPYAYALNSPLLFNDSDGKDAIVTVQKDASGGGKIIIASTIYITGKGANEFNAAKYTKKAAELYKSGSYTNEEGDKFEIIFDVKFE